jgi:predicted aspartyl protease
MLRLGLLMTLAMAPHLASAQTFEAPSAEFVAVGIERHGTGTYYIPGAIEGFGSLDLLVDTGSSYLVINVGMLEELKEAGRAEFSRQLEARMADGSTRVIPLYRLAGVRLGEACWVHDVEAAIFPANARPILGMNVLSRVAPFTFSAEPARLSLAHCQGPPKQVQAEAPPAEPDAVVGTGE